MNSTHIRTLLRAFGPAIVCGYLLNISTASVAQSLPQDAEQEELAPIILQERIYAQDSADLETVDFDDPMVGENPDVSATSESYDDQLRRLFTSYKEAVLDSMFEEADTLAKQIVELSIRVNGLDSRKSATALTNLAVAQHGLGDYPSAILNYGAAIGIIERLEDRLSGDLVNPLRGVGAAQFAVGRPDLAKSAFDRAIHISHVNDGPHNLEQIETLLSLSETYLSVGETKSAVDIQKRIFYLQARNISMDSVDIIPALQTRAGWQRRMRMYEDERFTLRRIIRVIERDRGKLSLDLIEPLTALGNSYLNDVMIGVPAKAQPAVSSGEPYLKRAIRIAEKNEAATWETATDAKLQLADYYVLSDRPGRAHTLYKKVWDVLSADESLLDVRSSMLESGMILRDIYPPTVIDEGKAVVPTKKKPAGYSDGTVVFSYSVNTRGRATNIKLLEAEPVGLDDIHKALGREVRFIVHRPRLVDRKPVQTDNLTFSHEFIYREAKTHKPEEEGEMVGDNAPSE